MKRSLFQSLFLVLISVVVGFLVNGFSSEPLPLLRPPDERAEKWIEMSADEVFQHFQEGSAILIDARDAKYYAEGHVPGSINLPASQFGEVFAEVGEALPRDFPLIVYCQGGPCDESHDVLDHLELLEFNTLFLYKGGWMEWEENEFPVEKGESVESK